MNQSGMTPSVRLCHDRELPEGGARGFDPGHEGRDTMFVVQQNGVYAYQNSCPHWPGTPMAWRKDAYVGGDRRSRYIVCSAHGARFAIETGVCILGPALGLSLTPVPIVIEPNGEIHLPSNTPTEKTS